MAPLEWLIVKSKCILRVQSTNKHCVVFVHFDILMAELIAKTFIVPWGAQDSLHKYLLNLLKSKWFCDGRYACADILSWLMGSLLLRCQNEIYWLTVWPDSKPYYIKQIIWRIWHWHFDVFDKFDIFVWAYHLSRGMLVIKHGNLQVTWWIVFSIKYTLLQI